jgi:hypothetical protein
MSSTVTEYGLALATLGGTTRKRNNPVCVTLPKVAKARTMVSVACRCRGRYLVKHKDGLRHQLTTLLS